MSEAKHIEQPDPLIDEIRAIRAELHAKFPNNLKAYVEYMNKVSAEFQKEMAEAHAKENAPQEKSPR